MKKFEVPNGICYLGDCLEVLKTLPDKCAQLTFTSPPYNMNLKVVGDKYVKGEEKFNKDSHETKYTNFGDNLLPEEYFEFHKNVLNELMRVSNLVVWNIQSISGNKLALHKLLGHFAENIKEVAIWNKGWGQPAIADGVMNSQFEFVYFFTDNKHDAMRRNFKDCGFARGTQSNVWDISGSVGDKAEMARDVKLSGEGLDGHRAIFPQKLTELVLFNFSKPGDTILDPFFGSGTVGLVAQSNKRKFIGIEQSEEYLSGSIKRLEGKNLRKDGQRLF